MAPRAVVPQRGTQNNIMSLSRYIGQIRPAKSVFWTFAAAELLIAGYYRSRRDLEQGFAS